MHPSCESASRPAGRKLGADWLGVDVNTAARVMESATKGGVLVSGPTVEKISAEHLDGLGVSVKQLRKPVFWHRPSGVPANMRKYRLETRRQLPSSRSRRTVTRRRGLSDLRCAHCGGRYRDDNWQWNRNEEPRLFGGKKWLAIGGHRHGKGVSDEQ